MNATFTRPGLPVPLSIPIGDGVDVDAAIG